MILKQVNMFGPDAIARPITRILLCLLGFVALGCHADIPATPTIRMKTGDDTKIECVSTTCSEPKPTSGTLVCSHKWFHPNADTEVTPAAVDFTPGSKKGAYFCQAFDTGDNNTASEKSAQFDFPQPKKPAISALSNTGELECEVSNCDGSIITACTYKWFKGSDPIAGHTVKTYTPTKNDVYKCQAINGVTEGALSDPKTITELPNTPCIKLPTQKPTCGATVTITCNAAGHGTPLCAAGTGTGATEGMGVGNDTSNIMAEVGRKAAKQTLEVTVTAVNGDFWCLAHTVDLTGGLTSISDPDTMACNAAPTKTPTSAASVNPGSTGGGKDVTTSGASDLGRPASVLTIVCSLLTLTLTLALRG